MSDLNLPLSGPVTQTFPWANYFTINVGQSSDPEMEKAALSVASYGKQLGRIGDALEVLIDHAALKGLSREEADAINILKGQLAEIRKVKAGEGAG